VSRKGLSTWQKATALVPLALLSGAWTTSLAVTSGDQQRPAASQEGTGTLPDGTSLPAEAIEAPASLTAPGQISGISGAAPGEISPGVPEGTADRVVASSSANGIPAAALAAYQRSADVMANAEPGCRLGWELVAAIGRVESDHGRYGGNTLNDEGVSTPGIYGIPLDGSNGTARITDTDAGQYDDDPALDRAVGPMQFIPSTWSVIGVDGDGDGERNPQDIDDAALATGVYLCSGGGDLSSTADQREAVYRYNHSNEYVDLVLSIMAAYSGGDFAAVPNGSAATPTFTPSYADAVFTPATRGAQQPRNGAGGNAGGAGGGNSKAQGNGGASGSGGSTESAGTAGGSGGSGGGTPAPAPAPAPTGGGAEEVTEPVKETTKKVTEPVKETVKKVEDTVKDPGGALKDTTDKVGDGVNGATGGLLGN
jgi:hypothetical protein